MNGIPSISERWEAEGYWSSLDEEDEYVVLVGYKDMVLAAFSLWAAKPHILDGVCDRHYARLTGTLEAVR